MQYISHNPDTMEYTISHDAQNHFNEQSKWNPRIFAYCVSYKNGEYIIQTIRPRLNRDNQGELSHPYSFQFVKRRILQLQSRIHMLRCFHFLSRGQCEQFGSIQFQNTSIQNRFSM